ncbi:hypothetical protein FRB90_004722 [Tulasnella sp. 427]|nr:hypothetical protein FRB90_004722 [Tulasnella sp. 427]
MPSYVITGGRGIAYEFAKQLSSKPENHIFSVVRSPASVPELGKLAAENKNLHILTADLTDLPALKQAAKDVAAITGGTLDVLLNVAAWVPYDSNSFKTLYEFKDNEEVLVQDLRTGFEVNVIGVIYTINSFLPLLRAGRTKKVVTLSTGLADPDFSYLADQSQSGPYAISKAATNMVNSKYAADFAEEGFVFVAISPGMVDTATPGETQAGAGGQRDEQMAGIMKMVAGFKKAFPNFTGQPMSPTESVNLLLGIVDTLKPEENGTFISHHRNKEWL